jgi:hypothetical protein
MHNLPIRPALRPPRHRPGPPYGGSVSSLELWRPYRVSPMRAVPAQDSPDCSDHSNAATPSEVSAPAAFSWTRGATDLTCGIPYRRLRLRPQGFAPSRRFAPPMTCRACFIPVPLLGLTLRGFEPPLTPCSLSVCQHPQGFCRTPGATRSPSLRRRRQLVRGPPCWGFARQRKPMVGCWVFHQDPGIRASMGLSLQGFLPLTPRVDSARQPLTRFLASAAS